MLDKIFKSLFKIENLPIFLILVLAAYMRLYKIADYMVFLGDEGRDVLVVKHILDGNITLLGPTASVGGFFLGPIYYYMMAPFLFLFNYNPVGPAVMVALFGVATVWLVYKVTKEFFGYYPGLIAALLYAVAPLVIIYSRSSWNPNTVPFFSLLMLYLVCLGTIKKSWIKILAAGILFGILLQLHYLTTFLGVVVGMYVLIASFYQSKNLTRGSISLIKRYLIFASGTLLGWSPFLLFELRHGFQNIQSIVKFIFESGETGGNEKYLSVASDVFMRVFGRLLLAYPRIEDMHLYNYDKTLLEFWIVGGYILGIAALVFLIFKLVRAVNTKDNSFYSYLLLLIWLVIVILLFGFYKKSIYDYYLGVLFPLPFILFGGLVSIAIKKDVSWRKQNKIWMAVVFLVVFALAMLSYSFRQFRIPGNQQLKQVKDISDFVLSKTDGKPFNFAVISAGGNSDYAYRYFFETKGMPPVTIQFPGADPARNTITDQLLIVCETVPCQPQGYSLWEVAGFGPAEIAGEWPVSVIKVYRMTHVNGQKPTN